MPPSPGLQQIQHGLEIIDNRVLDAKVKNYLGTGKPIVDQSAALMVEDTRAFVQGMEQVFMMAMSKATSMLLDAKTMKTGAEAMGYIQSAMKFLPAYTVQMGESAAEVVNNWETMKSVKVTWPPTKPTNPKPSHVPPGPKANEEDETYTNLSVRDPIHQHFKNQPD